MRKLADDRGNQVRHGLVLLKYYISTAASLRLEQWEKWESRSSQRLAAMVSMVIDRYLSQRRRQQQGEFGVVMVNSKQPDFW